MSTYPILGFTEPKCILYLGGIRSTISTPKKTEKKNKNRDPNIRKSVVFDNINYQKDSLKIEFWDTNDHEEEVQIGSTELSLSGLEMNKEKELVLKLTEQSEVVLSVKLFTNKPESQLSDEEIKNPGFVFEKKNEPIVSSPGSLANSGSSPNPQRHNFKAPTQKPKQEQLKPKRSVIYFKPEDIKRDFPQLSRGSFGTVFTGNVTGVPQKVVIKDMEIKDKNTIEEWKKEIDMMNKTRCLYVVDVIGYSSSHHILTIVMEYMKKGSLYDMLHTKKEKLSLLQRMRMARHCALGLQFLHSLGIIHRDIKSMNILVGDDLSCKLTDFGTAKSINHNYYQMNTANSGTPLWMAPEVKLGMAYDYSADIYSLGLVLFELFELKLPHYNQMTQSVELPHSFRSSTIVLQCISRNPQHRPTASSVVDILNKMIRNILTKVRSIIDSEEETLVKIKAMNLKTEEDDTEAELLALYMHLLQKPPQEVDKLIDKAFGEPEESNSPNVNNSSQYVNKYSHVNNYHQPQYHMQQPNQMQYYQQPMVYSPQPMQQNYPMSHQGYYVPQQYPYYPPM